MLCGRVRLVVILPLEINFTLDHCVPLTGSFVPPHSPVVNTGPQALLSTTSVEARAPDRNPKLLGPTTVF